MSEPVWVDKALLLDLYQDVVAASGGAVGLRDEGLLDSAYKRMAFMALGQFLIDNGIALTASPGHHFCWSIQERMARE